MRWNDRLAEFDAQKDAFEEQRWSDEMKKAIRSQNLPLIRQLAENGDLNGYDLTPFKEYLSNLPD